MALSLDQNAMNAAAFALLGLHQCDEKLEWQRPSKTQNKLLVSNAMSSKKRLDEPSTKKRKLAPNADPSSRIRRNKQRRSVSGSKHVRFGTDESFSFEAPPMVQVFVYDPVREDEAPDVWWTSEEVEHILRRERSLMSIMSHCCGFYMEQLNQMISIAWEEDTEEEDEEAASSEKDESSLAPMWVSNSPARGLEKDLVKRLLLRQEGEEKYPHRGVVPKVLKAQKQLQGWSSTNNNNSRSHGKTELLLRELYQRLSEPYARFSYLVASGDARVVEEEEENMQADTTCSIETDFRTGLSGSDIMSNVAGH